MIKINEMKEEKWTAALQFASEQHAHQTRIGG